MSLEVISRFRGRYNFLSNFSPSPFELDGRLWPTVEHAFQAAKTEDKGLQEQIRTTEFSSMAKRLGRQVPLRKDWEKVKVEVMGGLLVCKFSKPTFKQLLLDTGKAYIIEGNKWHDNYWGVCQCAKCMASGPAYNVLGHLLMGVRRSLLAEVDGS